MKKYFYILFLLLFTACTPKYTKHEASVIVLKTPKIAFADMGFVHDDGKNLKIITLLAGEVVFDLVIGRKICLNSICLNKKKFIYKYLSHNYPSTILQNIFLGKPIFKGLNIQNFVNGFKQKLYKKGAYNIDYQVLDQNIRFKDKISKIIIKTKKIMQ